VNRSVHADSNIHYALSALGIFNLLTWADGPGSYIFAPSARRMNRWAIVIRRLRRLLRLSNIMIRIVFTIFFLLFASGGGFAQSTTNSADE
jgi:hypothetical protein